MKIKAYCPVCAYEVDDASGIGDAAGARPEPGNLAICIRCAGVGVYFAQDDNTLGLRPPTDAENAKFADDEQVTRVRALIVSRETWGAP